MQNFVALGAIMGKLNIPLPLLPENEHIMSTQHGQCSSQAQPFKDVGKDSLNKAVEGPNQDQKFIELLVVLRISLLNNYITYKRALAKNINFIRAVSKSSHSREHTAADRAKNAQITAFPEAYLYRNKGVTYIYPTTKQCKQLIIPGNCVKSNMRLIITLESDLKYKRNKKADDVEMIRILKRYLLNADTMLPNLKINNSKDDKDDDEQKHNEQKPSGSNASQSSRATDSNDRKQDEKK
ncbi:hypothetical protein AgCh_034322 [Apium graveolens]